MNLLSIIMAIFSIIGAIDLILGNRFGIGEEFEKGLKMFGSLALSMIGMIVLAPCIANLLTPVLKSDVITAWVEPSVIMGSIFANDMGGASLAKAFAVAEDLGCYNGLVVGSMMGATISFTLPFALNEVKEEKHGSLFLGLMCGICTIPVGCFVAGLVAGFSLLKILWDLIPLVVFSIILIVGLLKFPKASVRIFHVFGEFIRTLIIVGLVVGILEYLLQIKILPCAAPIMDGVDIVFNIVAVMTGAFPLIYLLSKLLKKPLKLAGKKVGISETAALGFLSTLATSITTFGQMKDMDDKGVLLNSAFAVSAAFTFADHLAFTLSFNASYVWAVIIGKLLSGVLAVLMAWFLFCRKRRKYVER